MHLVFPQVKAFFAKYPEAGAGATSRKQAIESIENNIKWKALNEKAVFDWLKTHYSVQTDSWNCVRWGIDRFAWFQYGTLL